MNANTNPRLSHTDCNHPRTAAARKICRVAKAKAVGITNETATTFEAHGITFTKPVMVDTKVKLRNPVARKIQRWLDAGLGGLQVMTVHACITPDMTEHHGTVQVTDEFVIIRGDGNDREEIKVADVRGIERTMGPGKENDWLYLV